MVLDMGRRFEPGAVREAERAGASLEMGESTGASPDWELSGGVGDDATRGLSYDALAGEYLDEDVRAVLSDNTSTTVQVEIRWVFEDQMWVTVPAGEGP